MKRQKKLTVQKISCAKINKTHEKLGYGIADGDEIITLEIK